MNIAYLNHGLYFGGATASLMLMLKSLEGGSCKRYLIYPRCSSEEMRKDFLKYCVEAAPIHIPQIHNTMVTHSPFHRVLLGRLWPMGRLLNYLREKRIDVLHVNTTVYPHVLGAVKRRTSIKVVTHLREQIPPYGSGGLQRYVLGEIGRWSDALIAISDNEARPFLGHPRLHVMPNPFDDSVVDKTVSTFRKDNGIPDGTVLVGMMGQFHKLKGHEVFLEALRRIVEGRLCPDPFLFVILGASDIPQKGPKHAYGEAIRSFIKRHGLERHVRFFPYVYQVFGALKALDIVVRPSLSGDPWGRDIIEAMSFSKPVVATGTSAFFVQEGQTGFLVPPGDAGKLAERLVALMNQPVLREEFGRKGRERVRSMCDLNAYGKKLEAVYESLR